MSLLLIMKHYIVYSRSDCHLCDVMKDSLTRLNTHYTFSFSNVDIDANSELVHQYGFFVPVLTLDGDTICHYELDEAAFKTSLALE